MVQLESYSGQLFGGGALDESKVAGMSRWLNAGSRMRRESHVRFCEGLGGKFPWATLCGDGDPILAHAFTPEFRVRDGVKVASSALDCCARGRIVLARVQENLAEAEATCFKKRVMSPQRFRTS